MIGEKALYHMENIMCPSCLCKKYDYFLLAFNDSEERSMMSLRLLLEKNSEINKLIVFVQHRIVREIGDEISDEISKIKSKISEIIMIDIQENMTSLDSFKILKAKIEVNTKNQCIGVDISCLELPLYYLIIKWLSHNICSLFIYYTEPRRYIMDDGLFKSYFSTKGPIDVKNVNGYEGITVKGTREDRVLICILGFDHDLLPAIIQEASPEKIVALNGFPSYFPKFKDISLANNERVLSESTFVHKFERGDYLTRYEYVDADNPFDTYNVLYNLYEKYKDYCVDIVPLGSKPTSLGACIFAIDNPDIRVLYPFPEQYAEAISMSSKQSFEYFFEFCQDEQA